ncbi:MAG: thiamine phosphate synthase [Acidobacteria bacterium]|nr:thiamine phosphate synthase [Acidobacteriota bacterium]
MQRYLITDRRLHGGMEGLLGHIARVPCEMIQIREKDLPVRELSDLVRRAVAAAPAARVLVNTRADVAMAAGAGGVHLTSACPSPALFRRIAPPGFLIGVSCHNLAEVHRAEEEGADFAVFGPVYSTGTKQPVGVAALREVCRRVSLPVYALGGVTWERSDECLEAGAVGVAGITLFSRAVA